MAWIPFRATVRPLFRDFWFWSRECWLLTAMPVAHAALELHANWWLWLRVEILVPLSSVRLVSVMNTGAVCYTFTVTGRGCQSLCILGLLVQPPLPPSPTLPSHPRVSPKAGCQSIAETPPALPLCCCLCHRPEKKVQQGKKELQRYCSTEVQWAKRISISLQRNYCTECNGNSSQTALCRADLDPSWDCLPPKWDQANFYETHTFNNLHFQTILLSKIWKHPLSLFQWNPKNKDKSSVWLLRFWGLCCRDETRVCGEAKIE